MLTVLQEKLAEGHGHAMAAAVVVGKVAERTPDSELERVLRGLEDDAAELRARCLEVERSLGGEVATELLAHANATKEKAADLAGAWFKAGTGPLAAWAFLAMAEAGEVAVWRAVCALAPDGAVGELAAWALPVQERHLQSALEGSTRLAEGVQPGAERWG
jgi:hypothetical protein